MNVGAQLTLPASDQNASEQTRLRVAAGSCLDCGGDVAAELRKIPGVRGVVVHAAAGVIVVDHDKGVSSAELGGRVARLGLRVQPTAHRPDGHGTVWWRQPTVRALAGAGVLLLAGLLAEKAFGLAGPAAALYWATLFVGGIYPMRSGLAAARRGRLTISTLLVVAAAGAVALGVIEEAAVLVVVFSLGEVLEGYASDRARRAIRALMRLAPPLALRARADGTQEKVPVEALQPDDAIVVRPGERVATDGSVVEGTSAIDQSAVTGESLPVDVAPGSTVFGGTLNGNGGLLIRVTKEYGDTTLARIIRQVEEAQASKGRAQRFADRFGAVYTPAMFAVAALVAVIPPLLGHGVGDWVYRSLVVLTVSCSCALVMSVPISIIAAVTRAARAGILIKGGAHLEALASVRVVAFDKTGTVTLGRPRLTDVVPFGERDADEILRLAAGVEAASEHPLAGAVLRAAEERGLRWENGRDLRAIPGMGVEATVSGRRLFVGKPQKHLPDDVARALAGSAAEGKTAVILSSGSELLGLLAIADEVRPHAAEVVSSLRRLGIEHIVMLTGDNEPTAASVARRLGINEYRAALLPEEKTAAVKALRDRHGPIAMVGDGVNDAPALATADVGIAMGAAGTDVALETADVALMADDLGKLPEAIVLARRARANLRQNITMSLVAVAALVAGALMGELSLTTGLLLNEGSALLIIGNGLRLLATRAADQGSPAANENPHLVGLREG
jgi:Cd2+/Zn2+-exporting ATPase